MQARIRTTVAMAVLGLIAAAAASWTPWEADLLATNGVRMSERSHRGIVDSGATTATDLSVTDPANSWTLPRSDDDRAQLCRR
jgi:hypothetical protein